MTAQLTRQGPQTPDAEPARAGHGRLRAAWHQIRQTTPEMNYASRRVVECRRPGSLTSSGTRSKDREVDSFTGKLAVVTGGGSGMGRELVRQLAAQGCSVATCDLNAEAAAVTAATSWAAAPPGVKVTGHACDVSDEAQVLRFRDELLEEHDTGHVELVFSNAGMGGGESFVKDPREEWERTFAINWWGVYFCARAFLPLLIASGDGVLVNTSSVAGFWATAGHGVPLTAYCASEFAIKGFSEALIADLRANAPQVRVVVVMPGQVNTEIAANSRRALGLPDPSS